MNQKVKTILIVSSILILSISGIFLYRYLRDNNLKDVFYHSNWLFRRMILVENDSSSALLEEDVLIELNTEELISAQKLKSDCSDIRFLDSDNKTQIEYWIEGGCNSYDTQIWLKIPKLPKEGSTIYLYYGNSQANDSQVEWGGKFLMQSLNSCTEGSKREDAFSNRFPIGSSTFGEIGGKENHTHTLDISKENCRNTTNFPNRGGNICNKDLSSIGFSEETNIPEYTDMYFCSNSKGYLFKDQIIMLDTETPESFFHVSDLDNKYIKGINESETITKSPTIHNHTSTCEQIGEGEEEVTTFSVSDEESLPPFFKLNFVSTPVNKHIPEESILIFDQIPPLGWTYYNEIEGYFPLPSAEGFKQTGGTGSHKHEIISGKTIKSSLGIIEGCLPASTDISQSLPPYIKVLFAKKKESQKTSFSKESDVNPEFQKNENSLPETLALGNTLEEYGSVLGDSIFYKTITIDHTKLSTDVTNLPVLISRTDTDLKHTSNGGKVFQTDGGDILFSDDTGVNKYDHEIESYDPTTGTLVAWVKIPSVSSSTDTTFRIYYGSSVEGDQWNPTGVWSEGYEGVWHLSEYSGGSGAVTRYDSTSNSNNLTDQNTTASAQGIVGLGADFERSNNEYLYITDANQTGLDLIGTSFTISFWIKPETRDTDHGFISKGNIYDQNVEYIYGVAHSWYKYIGIYSDDWSATWKETEATTTIAIGVWAYIYYIHDAENDEDKIYVNGVLEKTETGRTIDLAGSTAQFRIGRFNYYTDGVMDEVRVSSNVKSSGYILATYNNQTSPSTFLSFGTEYENNSSPNTPTNLLTEGVSNPSFLESSTPFFTAQYSDPDEDSASAYQIQVNTNTEFTGTEMWDSGKISTTVLHNSTSPNYTYSGTNLTNTGNTLYWRIKFWDTADNESNWSTTGTFVDLWNRATVEGLSIGGLTLN